MSSKSELTSTPAEQVSLKAFIDLAGFWWRFLLKRWWIVAISAIVGGGFGIAYAYFTKARYTAIVTFTLEDGGGNSLGAAASLAAQFGFDIGGVGQQAFSGDNILQIITTRKIVERTLFSKDSAKGKTYSLLEYYLSHKDLGASIRKNKRLSTVPIPTFATLPQNTYLQDSLLFVVYDIFMKQHLSAFKPDKKLSIYEVDFTCKDEYFSKIFVEKLLEETSSFYSELKTKKSQETLNILQNRVDSLRGALNSSITRIASAQDANLNPALLTTNVPSQQTQVSISTYAGAYAELYKNLEIVRYQTQKEKPLLQIIQEARYPLKKIKKGRLFTGLTFGVIFAFLALISMVCYRYVKEKLELLSSAD